MASTKSKILILVKSLLIFLMLTGVSHIPLFSQSVNNNYAILIGGLGGGSEYSEKFRQYLLDTWQALVQDFKFPPENIFVLSESGPDDEGFINGVSNIENIRRYFGDIADRIGSEDNLYVILFGHGSFDGKNAKLNIPRKDLTDKEYGELVDGIPASRIIFINTASASAPFIEHLSSPGRIVITATKSGTQKNQPLFAGYFVEALKNASSDLDKNGNLSVLEVFKYASDKTFRWYEDNNHLATEHPQLEDTGDKNAVRVTDLSPLGEGNLAEITYMKNSLAILTGNKNAEADSVLIRLMKEKADIEIKIAELRSKKVSMTETEYFDQLEKLLLDLARINDEIERKGKN